MVNEYFVLIKYHAQHSYDVLVPCNYNISWSLTSLLYFTIDWYYASLKLTSSLDYGKINSIIVGSVDAAKTAMFSSLVQSLFSLLFHVKL
jgi:hypothetical protein